MNWDAIGASAETLGALAVFGTLLYLAVQVRHVKVQMHLATLKDYNELFAAVTNSVASSPELARVIEKAKSDTSLESWEQRMLDSHFISWMNAFELLRVQVNVKALDMSDETVESVLVTFLTEEPWASQCWERKRN